MITLTNFNWVDCFYAFLTVVVTVILIIFVRKYGGLPNSLFGPDLNLLTYGFLWDTITKAIREQDYWPRFNQSLWPINKPTTLAVIFLVNIICLCWNMRLAYQVEQAISAGTATNWDKFVKKPYVISIPSPNGQGKVSRRAQTN